MNRHKLAPLSTWLTEPLPTQVAQSVDRLRAAEGVRRVAIMPDVHLARDVCVGAVVAADVSIYPQAVGGDIGCGMAALAFDVEADALADERAAASVLAGLYDCVPTNKHLSPQALPTCLTAQALSEPRLTKRAQREGAVQLGTLGRGNHFLEIQADQANQLCVMVHSGSRAMGQEITKWHLGEASVGACGLARIEAEDDAGRAYLSDVQWARAYARENRLAMLRAVEDLLGRVLHAAADWDSLIQCDHNHVQQESHAGRRLWVHRKGTQSAREGEQGVIPGSMGTASFHTAGRGRPESLHSCSHGAGRRLSRAEARRDVSGKEFARQMERVWFDHRRAARLRDEAPAAYKDIHLVMRAQSELVRIVRELRPVLSYKGV